MKDLGELKLVPGMPAEALIETGVRTPLEFLLKPLQEQIARTFRER
jgi:HlyD family secretion protein